MNILKKISAVAVVIAVATLSSCSDKAYWEEAPLEAGVSFQSTTYNENLGPGANEVVIPVSRTVNTGEQTVSVTFTPDKDCPTDISVPSQVTFPAGSNSANIVITIANAMPPYTYSGTLELQGDASYSGTTSLTFTLPVSFTWTSLGNGTFLDAFVMGDVEPYSVEILKAEGFERYRVLNPYVEYYTTGGAADNGDWYANNGPSYIEFWENGNGTLSFNPWGTGLIYDGNPDTPINAYPWNAFSEGSGFSGELDIWYQPGFAVLSPIYYIPGVGSYGQQQYAVQIELP